MRRTKIIASLGPASFDPDTILMLAREGADAFRLNFSHGTLEEKELAIKAIREVERKLGTWIPIIGDLQGPTIRLGDVEEPYQVRRGDELFVVNRQHGAKGEIPLPSRKVYDALREGDILLIEGGRLVLRVERILPDKVKVVALNDGVLRSRRTVTLKDRELDLPPITEKDVKDIEFCIKHKVDFIALSFVRSADDISTLRNMLEEHGGEEIRIIAKIETRSAVENLGEIIDAADAVLIARGDLGLYFSLELIPRIQETIVRECLRRGKPSILATQLLESMVENPMPTRAEVVDVMNAVLQGVDALLLADETAVGRYPIESVRWLNRIILEAERRAEVSIESPIETIYDKFARGVTLLAESVGAKIVAFTRRGNTPRRLSRYRPRCPIYAIATSETIARQLRLLWGVRPYFIPGVRDPEDAYQRALEMLKTEGELGYGDIVIFTAGLRPRATDLAKIEIVR